MEEGDFEFLILMKKQDLILFLSEKFRFWTFIQSL